MAVVTPAMEELAAVVAVAATSCAPRHAAGALAKTPACAQLTRPTRCPTLWVPGV